MGEMKWMHIYYIKGKQGAEWNTPKDCSWIVRKMMSYKDLLINSQYWNEAILKGEYQTKSMYKEIRGEKLQTSWYRLFYTNSARPHAKFIMWLACLDRLATKERLVKFGVVTNGVCVFCGLPKRQEHILFACSMTSKIWQEVLA